jgi:hypothetical protein
MILVFTSQTDTFLLAKIACQLGLTGGLLLNDRRDEVADPFELMTVCPGQ